VGERATVADDGPFDAAVRCGDEFELQHEAHTCGVQVGQLARLEVLVLEHREGLVARLSAHVVDHRAELLDVDRRTVLQMPDDSPEPPALNAIAHGLDKPLLVRRHQQHLELLADGRGVRLRVCHGDVADEGLLFMRFERAAAVAVLRRALGGFRIGRKSRARASPPRRRCARAR